MYRAQVHPRTGPAPGGGQEAGALLADEAECGGDQFGRRALRAPRLARFQVAQGADADHGPLGEVRLRHSGPLAELSEEYGKGW